MSRSTKNVGNCRPTLPLWLNHERKCENIGPHEGGAACNSGFTSCSCSPCACAFPYGHLFFFPYLCLCCCLCCFGAFCVCCYSSSYLDSSSDAGSVTSFDFSSSCHDLCCGFLICRRRMTGCDFGLCSRPAEQAQRAPPAQPQCSQVERVVEAALVLEAVVPLGR